MPDSAPATTHRRSSASTRAAESLLGYDREHVWHPYSSMVSPSPVLLIESADGVRLTTSDGRRLIDAMSSWWCAIHGYRHSVLDAALQGQSAAMSHVMFGGLTHRPAIELAETLVDMTPRPLQRVFFADSGSVSVEVAIKMAVQYQRGNGRPGKTRLLSLRGGYHGDTAGAMSVCDPVGGMHAMFSGLLPPQVFAPRPPGGLHADIAAWEQDVRALAARHAGELAAVICEPVLQGAGGMHIYPPQCLQVLRDVADTHDLLLIFDEIATGFGRTGELFAADHAGVAPDVLCVGKALTGGYLTLAATLCTDAVARGLGASESGVLMHGPTFMANPLACSVASANLGLLAQRDWRRDVHRIEAALSTGLAPLRGRAGVSDVRVLGAVGVVQLDHPVDVVEATAAAVDCGVWLRPFRDLVYTMPPYIASNADVASICTAMAAAAAASGADAPGRAPDDGRAGTGDGTR
jgi:adenosylmethionine-8-amino-7-oxononanoate aminotransferase